MAKIASPRKKRHLPEGAKAKGIVHDEIGEQKIIVEIAGNNRYIAATRDTIYVGSAGIASGSLFGRKVKKYPLDMISSIDVRKSLLITELEIVMAGAVESGRTNQGLMGRAQNENITGFPRHLYEEVQQVANTILSTRRELLDVAKPFQEKSETIPDQIEQLAQLRGKGILSEEEFQTKKKDLLARM